MADQGRIVKLWYRKATDDLQTAKFLLEQGSENFYGAVVFHSQQAAEKSLKGFLAYNKIRFSKTHDLEILIKLISSFDLTLSTKLMPSIILSKYATSYRYPEEIDSPENLNQKNCEKIFDMGQFVFQEIWTQIYKNE